VLKLADALSWTGVPRLANSHTASPNFPPQAKLAEGTYFSCSLSVALQEMEALNATLATAGQMRQLGNRPIVVLTAMKPLPAEMLQSAKLTEEQTQQIKTVWKGMHDDEASWSHHTSRAGA
jgi:hypothetical protein